MPQRHQPPNPAQFTRSVTGTAPLCMNRPNIRPTNPAQFKRSAKAHDHPVSTAPKKTGHHIQRSSRDLLPALILSACSGPKIRPPHPAQFRRSAKAHVHLRQHRPQEIERHIRRDSDTPARVVILSVPTALTIRPPPPAQLAQSVTDTDLFRAHRPEDSGITSHAAKAICCLSSSSPRSPTPEINRLSRSNSRDLVKILITSARTEQKTRPPPPAQLTQSVPGSDLLRAQRPEISASRSRPAHAI